MKEFDKVGFIMDYEGGELSEEKIIEGFQYLLDSGDVWLLQGSYGRIATNLIKEGLIKEGWTPEQRRQACLNYYREN